MDEISDQEDPLWPGSDERQWLDVAVRPDGRLQLLYGADASVRMATCVDVACSDVSIVEVLDTSPWVLSEMSAALREDGSPVFLLDVWQFKQSGPEDFERRLVWCLDPECSSLDVGILPPRVHLGPEVVSAPDGRIAVFDVKSTAPITEGESVGASIGFQYCDGPTCLDDATDWIELAARPAGVLTSFVHGGFDHEGAPLAVYAVFGDTDGARLHLVRCDDASCASVQGPVTVTSDYEFLDPGVPAVGPDGTIVVVSQGLSEDIGPGEIMLTTVESLETVEARSTVVFTHQSGRSCCFDGAVDSAGIPWVLWSSGAAILTRCTDASCTDFEPPIRFPVSAHRGHVVMGDDGAMAVATLSHSVAGTKVWLLRCEGSTCAEPSGDVTLFD